jgi:hypothetical protein
MTALHEHIRFAKRLVTLMDTKFSIFGFKFGIDPILNVIPWFGDVLGLVLSCYLFYIAYSLKVPKTIYLQMIWNVAFDYVLGLIPLAGVVFDLFFRANVKNYALLEKYFDPEILEGELIDA